MTAHEDFMSKNNKHEDKPEPKKILPVKAESGIIKNKDGSRDYRHPKPKEKVKHGKHSLEAGRVIYREDKPLINIGIAGDTSPEEADKLAEQIVKLIP
jgi:hypothetical protein